VSNMLAAFLEVKFRSMGVGKAPIPGTFVVFGFSVLPWLFFRGGMDPTV